MMTAAIRTLTIALIFCLSILTMIVLEYHPNIKGKHEITRFVVIHKQKVLLEIKLRKILKLS